MEKTKEKIEIETVQLGGGRTAKLLVPDLNENQELVVVDYEILKRLISYLNVSTMEETRENIISKINRTKNIKELCQTLTDEVNFHKSVNIIEKIIYQDIDYSKGPY